MAFATDRSVKKGLLAVLISMNPKTRWEGNNGYSHVLRICLPLIAANISVSAMLFTDRFFLTRYSYEAIQASLPAGITFVTMASFFQGLVAYVAVFTAQYVGAGRLHRASASLWQSLYLAILSGLLIASTWFVAPRIFEWGGHTPEVQELEVIYYRILCVPAILIMIFVALSSFLSGLGRTRMVMWVNLIGALVNIPLSYCLIFGVELGGSTIVPPLGIAGAALGTVIAWLVTVLIFVFLIFNRKMKKTFDIYQAMAFDGGLMRRMVRYGFPGGLQRVLELGTFLFFVFIFGRLGQMELAANNIMFSIESLAFFPMLGVGITISILVGQSIGRGQPGSASDVVISGIGISSVYVVVMSFIFLVFPRPLLSLFLADHYDPVIAEQILVTGEYMLRFVVAYTVFMGLYLCCFGALNGAGDVWFPTVAMGLSGFFGLVVPTWLLFHYDLATVTTLWSAFVFYVLILTAAGVWRYRQGKWRSMQVIEKV